METSESKSAAHANVNDFPKIYRQSAFKRFFVATISLIIFLPSIAFFIDSTPQPLSGLHRIFVWAAVALFPVIGFWMLAFSLTSKVTLYIDRIEQSWLFGTKSIARKEIQGFRISAFKGSTFVNLIPINDQLKVVSLPSAFATDAVFSAWLKELRNLDTGKNWMEN
jgi:hypothetical protein